MAIDEKTKRIISDLKSPDLEMVLNTIEKIKESGNLVVLDELIQLLHNTTFPEVKTMILGVLAELKNTKSVPILMAAIENQHYLNERKDLITCCWQNGLPYNAYLSTFIDLIIHEEFLIAFEAFTVIENMVGKIEEEIINNEKSKITAALTGVEEKKSYLLTELLTVLGDIPEAQ